MIVVTPAGRERYLRILVKHLERQKADFDEWHLWDNAQTQEDRDYINQLTREYSWIKCITRAFTPQKKAGHTVRYSAILGLSY